MSYNEKKELDLGEIKNLKYEKNDHTPSKIQADTLFTFTTKLEYLFKSLKNKMLSPRYCVEDIRYLKIRNYKKIAYPMKCFCDINLHRLSAHLDCYGYYGLAFAKKWGMDHGIQPIHYINPKSELCKDFSDVFNSMLKTKSESSDLENKMKNYIFHEMMYYKPYEGKIQNRNTRKSIKKCYTDECEWRFFPDTTILGYKQAYYDKDILESRGYDTVSDALEGKSEVSLQFEYSDLKYVIIKSLCDLNNLIDSIEGLHLEKDVERELISKIIVWENSRGDF